MARIYRLLRDRPLYPGQQAFMLPDKRLVYPGPLTCQLCMHPREELAALHSSSCPTATAEKGDSARLSAVKLGE